MQHPLLEIGSVLAGRYEIETVLASGGFATVYVARHLGLRSAIALKVLKPDLSDNPKIRKRFLREARVVTALRHPGIVIHHDLGEEADGRMYLAMELLDGRSLSWVLRQGPLAPARAAHMLRQIAAALDFSHEHGVLHRDLKPSNIMTLRYAGDPDHVKLIDFGVLKFLEAERRFDDGLTTNLTDPKAVIGTPEYMAPEQIRGQPLDARTDQYALGLVAWEALVGQRPFRAATRVEVLTAQLRDPPPPLTALACGLPVPPGLEDALRRVLAKAPVRRFDSCLAFVEAVAAACEPLFGVELPPSLPSLPSLPVLDYDEDPSEAPTRPSMDRATLEAVARRQADAATPVQLARVPTPARRGQTVSLTPELPPDRGPMTPLPRRAVAEAPDPASEPPFDPEIPPAPRRRALWWSGGLAAACVLGVAAFLAIPRASHAPPPGALALRGEPLAAPSLAPPRVVRPQHGPVSAGSRRLLEPTPPPATIVAALELAPLAELPAEAGVAEPPEVQGDEAAAGAVEPPEVAPAPPEVAPAPPEVAPAPPRSEPRSAPTATLSIAVRPTGRVWVDGRRVGEGLVTDLRVKAGHRKVKVSNDALGITRTIPVELTAGRHRKLLVDLETGRVDLH